MITLQQFLKQEDIIFKNEKQALAWVRRLRPKVLVKIGSSYFVDSDELKELLESYFTKKIALRSKRARTAKKLFRKDGKNDDWKLN